MTMHTIRGAIGIIKQLYEWHANVVTSSDMGVFLATSSGCNNSALELLKKKIDGAYKMRALYYAQVLSTQVEDIISWAWLYDAWMHHIQFHIMSSETLEAQIPPIPEKKATCKWDEQTKQ